MPRSRFRRHRQGLCHRNRRSDGRRSHNNGERGPEFSRERPDARPACHWISLANVQAAGMVSSAVIELACCVQVIADPLIPRAVRRRSLAAWRTPTEIKQPNCRCSLWHGGETVGCKPCGPLSITAAQLVSVRSVRIVTKTNERSTIGLVCARGFQRWQLRRA